MNRDKTVSGGIDDPSLAVTLGALAASSEAFARCHSLAAAAQLTLDVLRRTHPRNSIAVLVTCGTGGEHLVAHEWPGDPREHPAIQACLKRNRMTEHADKAEAGQCYAQPVLGTNGENVGVIALAQQHGPHLHTTDTLTLEVLAGHLALARRSVQAQPKDSSIAEPWTRTMDHLRTGICIIEDNVIVRCNPAFADMVQLDATDLVGQPWQTILPPVWQDHVRAAFTAPSGHEVNCSIDEQHYGIRVSLADATLPVVLIVEDRTAAQTLHHRMAQSTKMSAIGQLITGIAHDLNNPLASVIGFAEYLVSEAPDVPARLVEPLRMIHQDAERASKIVRNLLAFSRKQDDHREPMQIEEILEATLLLLRNQLIGLHVEARLHVEPNIPSIVANANQIQQVLVNLLTNAAHAANEANESGTVDISVAPWEDGISIEITDNGPGIDETLQHKIFEPFYTTKTGQGGTGLGLSICQGIVTEHGGNIRLVNSQTGAAFRVELPSGGVATGTPPSVTQDPSALRILVVDDEPHILHYMRAVLEEWHHAVEVASDGADALDIIAAHEFDVIITDLRMPNVDGRAFFEILRERQPEISKRVVFSTGNTVDEDTRVFLEELERPHLKKPFSLGELRAILPQAAVGGRV